MSSNFITKFEWRSKKIYIETQEEANKYNLEKFEKEYPDLHKAHLLLKNKPVGGYSYYRYSFVKNNVSVDDFGVLNDDSYFSDLTLEIYNKRTKIEKEISDVNLQLRGIIKASSKKELLEKFPELKGVLGKYKDSEVCTSLACITDLRTQLKLDKGEN